MYVMIAGNVSAIAKTTPGSKRKPETVSSTPGQSLVVTILIKKLKGT
jgi:hypothetical protein